MKHALALFLTAFALTALAQVDSTVFLNLCAFDSMLIGHVPNAPNNVSVTELPWLTSCSEQVGWQSLDFDDSDWNSPIHTSCNDGDLNNQLMNCGGMIDMIWTSNACEVSYFRGIVYANRANQKLEISVDNAFDLYVNDSLIHSGGPWQVCFEFDLTDLLNPGPNSIAVKGINSGGCKGMFGRAIGRGFHYGSTWNGSPSLDTQIWVHGPGEYIQEITDNSGQTEIYRFVVSSNNFQGCTDEAACNFDSNSFCDDGSCIYPAFQSDCDAASVVCGPGTVWDPQAQMCIVANPSDSNFDGCVQLGDLLDLLSAYGTCSTWQCGDPLSYQGYDYATVPIGDQCWFAENLQAENYRNGEVIPTGFSDSEWGGLNVGAQTIYGEAETCGESYVGIDGCDAAAFLNEVGRLYNWFAVDDSRGLCPAGWHVSSDEDWLILAEAVGGDSTEAYHLKATTGWNSGVSSNSSGFTALPGGFRSVDGSDVWGGLRGYWWTSTPSDPNPWHRRISMSYLHVGRNVTFEPQHGFSVRCIKDTE